MKEKVYVSQPLVQDKSSSSNDFFMEFEDEDLLEGLQTPPESQTMQILDDISVLSTPMFNKKEEK